MKHTAQYIYSHKQCEIEYKICISDQFTLKKVE